MARLTRTDAKLLEILNSKGAPDFSTLDYTAPDFKERYGITLNWIHQAVESDELIREAQSYFTRVGREDAAGLVKQVPFGIQQTMGKIAYCLNRGAQLSPKSHTYLDNGLRQAKPVPCMATEAMQDLAQSAAGKLTEAYVACYSRIDNLKTRVLRGLVELRDVPREVQTILESNGGSRVRARLVTHYQELLAEAQEDKLIRDWVKPLRIILKTLSVDAPRAQAVPQQRERKLDKVRKDMKQSKVAKPIKSPKQAEPKQPKLVREQGKGSFVQQVRQLIALHKPHGRTVREVTAMAEKLGMKPSSARNAVVGCWERV